MLRPALHEFGIARQYADERQLTIHSRSGNIGFVVVMLAAVGFALWRISRGQYPEELYELIFLGLAAKAITGLIMVGEYRKAGVVIISAVGVFLSLFIIAEGGFSVASIVGLVVGGVIVGFGQLARRFPKAIAFFLAAVAILAILLFDLYDFRTVGTGLWLFFIAPVITASTCLFLGRGDQEEEVSPRLRASVFGTLGAGAAVVFILLMIFGGRNEPVTSRVVAAPEGEVVEIQGISCVGSVEYYQDGKLTSCTLGLEDTLSGQPLPAGTVIHLTPEGYFDWCFLQQNTEIQGHLCRGESHGFMTGFHPNGQLKTAWLAQDEVIQGIPCAKFKFLSAVMGWIEGSGKDGSTRFHENGLLRYCALSENFTIEEQRFRRGDVVRFDRDGKLVGDKKKATISSRRVPTDYR
ncbi:MAG: hypothetical protein ABIE07_02520 [Candidatus Zixiibacteriota bacterium]